MTWQMFPVGGFVLVGGRSQRLGEDKALLKLQGQPLFLRTAELLRPYVAQVTLLGPRARFDSFGFPVLADRRLGRGPLEALCMGLESSPYDWNVFLACDLPYLEGRFLEFLLRCALACKADAIVPRTPGGWQPLCAAYHRGCLGRMRDPLEIAPVGIVDVLPALGVKALETDELAGLGFSERMFGSVNTPQDWEVVKHKLEEKCP